MRELIIKSIHWGPPCCQEAFKMAQRSTKRMLPFSSFPAPLKPEEGQGSRARDTQQVINKQ